MVTINGAGGLQTRQINRVFAKPAFFLPKLYSLSWAPVGGAQTPCGSPGRLKRTDTAQNSGLPNMALAAGRKGLPSQLLQTW